MTGGLGSIPVPDGGDATWELLGCSNYSPYRDERPVQVPGKPETRRYRARYVIADAEIGDMSDITIVIAQP